jgi:hypothetical protein
MQQEDSTFKYVQLWNDQPINTHHDILISVDYALYNYVNKPTCGFCIALFEVLNGRPRGGGTGYSLGYTPNDVNDQCNPDGYSGLESAIYGIGFDINGIFAKENNFVNGVKYTIPNSICVRNGIREDYSLVSQSDNLKLSHNFEIAQQLKNEGGKVEYKQVRAIFSKCMSELLVQVKEDYEKDFRTVINVDLPLNIRKKSLKVGLFYTSLDKDSRFLLKNFNVAGYPESNEVEIITSCYQELSTNSNFSGNILPANNEWIVSPSDGFFNLYKYNGDEYAYKKTTRSSQYIKILNYSEKFLYTKIGDTLTVFEYKGNNFIRQYDIFLPTGDDITTC